MLGQKFFLKNIVLVFFSVLLSGCVVPGTYFSKQTISNGYTYDGKHQEVDIVELNSKWLADYGHDQAHAYQVGPYDILNIIVWGHPELTTQTTQVTNPEESGILVNNQGYMFFPFAGEVKVSGLTVGEIREELQVKLETYIRNPQLSVRVATFRSQEVEVVGEVKEPGPQFITDRHLTAMEAINDSGGVNSITANTKQVFILSEDDGRIVVHWFNAQDPAALLAAEKFNLRKGSIIYVPPAGISAWNRVVTQIIPTLGGASSSKTVVE